MLQNDDTPARRYTKNSISFNQSVEKGNNVERNRDEFLFKISFNWK